MRAKTVNYLGIDWGQKRVGLARASSQAKLAVPLPSLPNVEDFTKQLVSVVKQERIDQLIVGLPRNLEGEETEQSREVRRFARDLTAQLHLPVYLQDESLTTRQVLEQPQTKFDRHSQAAVVILQDYLNEQVNNLR